MNGKVARRLLLILVAVVVVVGVAALAYHVGSNVNGGPVLRIGPGRMVGGYGMGYGWPGFGLFGLLAMIAIGFLVVWLIVTLVSGPSGGGRAPDSTMSGGVDRLRELSELHDKGALTDEEFTAAKRKLLGL
jgi:uncharacterized membrane protein